MEARLIFLILSFSDWPCGPGCGSWWPIRYGVHRCTYGL